MNCQEPFVNINHAMPLETTPVAIRRATVGEAQFVEMLYRELVDDPHVHVAPEQIAALADSPTSLLLVAEFQWAICATALLTICPDAMYGDQPFGVIENIIVTQRQRGHGIGSRLMTHIEQLGAARHCTKLMLLSNAARTEAHAFFRRCGFAGDTKHAFVKYRRQFTPASAEEPLLHD